MPQRRLLRQWNLRLPAPDNAVRGVLSRPHDADSGVPDTTQLECLADRESRRVLGDLRQRCRPVPSNARIHSGRRWAGPLLPTRLYRHNGQPMHRMPAHLVRPQQYLECHVLGNPVAADAQEHPATRTMAGAA